MSDPALLSDSDLEARTIRRLAVWLEGAPGRVGALIGDAGPGFALTFTYDPDYLSHSEAIPLSAALPLRASPYADAEARAFFDNLLPEGERRRREALTRRFDPTDVAGLLETLGRASRHYRQRGSLLGDSATAGTASHACRTNGDRRPAGATYRSL
jgi:HipA-like protein